MAAFKASPGLDSFRNGVVIWSRFLQRFPPLTTQTVSSFGVDSLSGFSRLVTIPGRHLETIPRFSFPRYPNYPAIGLRVGTVLKSRSLAVTTRQSLASAIAAIIMSVPLSDRP